MGIPEVMFRDYSRPGKLATVYTYDPAGQLTDLTYTGQVTPVTEETDPDTGETTWIPGTPEQNQPWLAWSRRYDITGRVSAEWNGAGAGFEGIPGVSDPADIEAPTIGHGLAADKRYIYDYAGRLTRAEDRTAADTGITLDPDTGGDPQAPCVRREYSFDKNGNRTKLKSSSSDGGNCFYASLDTESDYTYDALDRPLKAADGTDYVYDAFGRQTLIPEADAPVNDAGDISLTYFDDDLAREITQGGTTTTFELDALARRTTSTITGNPTVTRHYGDDTDNPAWTTNSDGMVMRSAGSLDGLGAIIFGDGAAALTIGNPHGDNVTTVILPVGHDEDTPAVSINGWADYDEYGVSKTGQPQGVTYGWLGKHERSASIESAGLTLMGVRLYNPVRGAFTTTDPVAGGNTTAYTYPQDPINMVDLDGLASEWVPGKYKDIKLSVKQTKKLISTLKKVRGKTKIAKVLGRYIPQAKIAQLLAMLLEGEITRFVFKLEYMLKVGKRGVNIRHGWRRHKSGPLRKSGIRWYSYRMGPRFRGKNWRKLDEMWLV